jgi:hypothetical protein
VGEISRPPDRQSHHAQFIPWARGHRIGRRPLWSVAGRLVGWVGFAYMVVDVVWPLI